MPRSEAGNAMGIVSLGAGLFGYFGPQMLGILRDRHGLVLGRVLRWSPSRIVSTLGARRAALSNDAELEMKSFASRCGVTVALLLLGMLHRQRVRRRPPAAARRPTGDQHRAIHLRAHRAADALPHLRADSLGRQGSLPIVLFLHGAGANESTYLDIAGGLLTKLAEQHGYIVVSPLGFTPLGAYGNPLRLPAVFGEIEDRGHAARGASRPSANASST